MTSRVSDFFKTLLKSKLVVAIASIVLGILFIVYQTAALGVVVEICGIILVISGIAFIVSYIAGGVHRTWVLLLFAALCILVGIVFIVDPEFIEAMFPIIAGISLIAGGIVNIWQSVMVMRVSFTTGILVLALSVVDIILGMMVVSNPVFVVDILVLFMGCSFLAYGIIDLIAFIAGYRRMRQFGEQ